MINVYFIACKTRAIQANLRNLASLPRLGLGKSSCESSSITITRSIVTVEGGKIYQKILCLHGSITRSLDSVLSKVESKFYRLSPSVENEMASLTLKNRLEQSLIDSESSAPPLTYKQFSSLLEKECLEAEDEGAAARNTEEAVKILMNHVTDIINDPHESSPPTLLVDSYTCEVLAYALDVYSKSNSIVVKILSVLVCLNQPDLPTNADNFISTGLLHALFHCLPVLSQHYQIVCFAFIHDCITFKTQTPNMKLQHEKNISQAAKVIFPVFAQYLRVTHYFYNVPSFPKNASGVSLCLGTCDEGYTRYYCGRAFGAEVGMIDASNGDDEVASIMSFNTAYLAISSSSEMTQCGPDSGLQCQECKDYTASSKVISALAKKEAEEAARKSAAAAVAKKGRFFGRRKRDVDKRASLGSTSLNAAAFADLATHNSGIFFCGKVVDATTKKKCAAGSIQCEECIALQALEVSRSVTRNYTSHILQVLRVIVKESAAKCLDEYDSFHDDVIALTKGTQSSLKLEAFFVVFSAIESLGPEVGIYVHDFLPVLQQGLSHKARKVRECASVTCGILARHVNVAFKEVDLRTSFTQCVMDTLKSSLAKKKADVAFRVSSLHKCHEMTKYQSVQNLNLGVDSLSCGKCKLPISGEGAAAGAGAEVGKRSTRGGLRSGFRGFVEGGSSSSGSDDAAKSQRRNKDECWHCDFCLFTVCADCCDKHDYKELLPSAKSKSLETDSLVGALALLLQEQGNVTTDLAATGLPLILSAMPLQDDVSENRSVINLLVSLLDRNDPVGMQNINQIASVFKHLLKNGNDSINEGMNSADKAAMERCLKTHADKIDTNSIREAEKSPALIQSLDMDGKSDAKKSQTEVELTNMNSHVQPKAEEDDTLNPMLTSNSPFSNRKGRGSLRDTSTSTFDPNMQAPLANCGGCCSLS